MPKTRHQAIDDAKSIVNGLAIALKVSFTYNPDNEVVVRFVDAFVSLVKPVLNSGKELKIELLGDYFYINEARIRYTVQFYRNFDYLITEFRKRDLGSITFSGDISRKDMQDFIKIFNTCVSSDFPYVKMQGDIAINDSIDIGPLKKVRADNLTNVRLMVKKNYFNAVSNLQSIVTRFQAGKSVDIKQARHAVHSLIDLMLQEEQMLISMTAIKDYDEYTYHHSVNVSILSVAFGIKLGLNKKKLSELGIAAFLHDIGKVNIPGEILNKIEPLTDAEWAVVKRHPSEGVKNILSSMKMDPVTVRSAIVSFEHHMNYDGSGYPPVPAAPKLDLYSNIITITDRYDAMTSSRVYDRVPKPPEEALRQLAQRAGKDIDPLLLKIFIRLTGVYPIGTMVILDTGEMGIVCRGNSDIPDRPMVILIYDSQGSKGEHVIADLAEKGPGGNYLRTIKKAVDAQKYDVNVAEYILESNE